jgi:hypothetical protein
MDWTLKFFALLATQGMTKRLWLKPLRHPIAVISDSKITAPSNGRLLLPKWITSATLRSRNWLKRQPIVLLWKAASPVHAPQFWRHMVK